MNIRLFLIFIFALFLTTANNSALSQNVKLKKGLYAQIETNRGNMLLKLFPEKSPLTVANFVGLSEGKFKVFDTIKHKNPFYNGIIFHRVIANFMIQVGDPTATGSGGPGYKFWDEVNNGLIFDKKGILAMANAGPNTNGSQIFITHVPTPHLNGKHTIFGEIIEGQNIVDAVKQGDTIKQVKIIKKGLKYKLFYNPAKEFKKEYAKIEQANEVKRLESQKIKAQDQARLADARSKTTEEYKSYFYNLVKQMEPDAIQTESGLVYVVKEEGSGNNPQKGDNVSLHYTGKFIFGDKFDSSYDRNSPLAFNYLEMGLIPGFNEGVGLSKKGNKLILYIPYFLAYGKTGQNPTIPPYSDLIFEIDILNIDK